MSVTDRCAWSPKDEPQCAAASLDVKKPGIIL
jgi:hypothetical protein